MMTAGVQVLRFSDQESPFTGSKPKDAAEMQLFLALGDKAAGDADEARYRQKVTRNPVRVEFGPADDGKVATYFARWASRRGEVGPWSAGLSARVMA